jgi:hypothetical protein
MVAQPAAVEENHFLAGENHFLLDGQTEFHPSPFRDGRGKAQLVIRSS